MTTALIHSFGLRESGRSPLIAFLYDRYPIIPFLARPCHPPPANCPVSQLRLPPRHIATSPPHSSPPCRSFYWRRPASHLLDIHTRVPGQVISTLATGNSPPLVWSTSNAVLLEYDAACTTLNSHLHHPPCVCRFRNRCLRWQRPSCLSSPPTMSAESSRNREYPAPSSGKMNKR